jgi:hypothetical protein
MGGFMRSIFRTVTILVALSSAGLVGCLEVKGPESSKFDFKTPEFEPIDIESLYLTCNKKDEEMPTLSEASKDVIRVNAEVEMQDYEQTDCDGKVIVKDHRAKEEYREQIEISALPLLSEKVTSVEVTNSRSCGGQFVSTEKTKSPVLDPSIQDIIHMDFSKLFSYVDEA